MTIYVPDDLKARMDEAGDLNESALARQAFEDKIQHWERQLKQVEEIDMNAVIERLQDSKSCLTEQRDRQDFERSVLWVETEVRHSEFMGQGSAAPIVPEGRRRAMITTDAVTEIEGIVEEFKRNLMKLAAISRVARTVAPFADWYAELPDAMTVSEFARRFSWTPKSVRNMIDRGELSCHQRAGCSIRILKPQVLAWVEANCVSLDDDNGALIGGLK